MESLKLTCVVMSHREIPLTQGMVALVSEIDFERVSQFKWSASRESMRGKKWYAIRWSRSAEHGTRKRHKIRLHRFVMGLGTGFEDVRVVDHLNDDSLDNRRENLEIISQAENMARVHGWNKKVAEPCL